MEVQGRSNHLWNLIRLAFSRSIEGIKHAIHLQYNLGNYSEKETYGGGDKVNNLKNKSLSKSKSEHLQDNQD